MSITVQFDYIECLIIIVKQSTQGILPKTLLMTCFSQKYWLAKGASEGLDFANNRIAFKTKVFKKVIGNYVSNVRSILRK